MIVLVFGATGFGGSYLTRHLAEETQWKVFATRRWNSTGMLRCHLDDRVEFLDCDIQSLSNVLGVLSETRPDLIFLSAADISIRSSIVAPDRTLSTNIFGLLNILEGMKRFSLKARLVLIGSCEVYGQVNEGELPVREEQVFRPQNTYGVSKAAQDLLAFQYFRSFNMDIVRTRTFHYTGVGQSDLYVCSSFARQIAEIEREIRPAEIRVGNLKVQRDFLDVRDLPPAYHAVALRGQAGQVYNICSGKMISIEEILNMLLQESTVNIRVVVDSGKLRPADNLLSCGDNTRIMEHTGWQPTIPFSQTLKDLLTWWRGQVMQRSSVPIAS